MLCQQSWLEGGRQIDTSATAHLACHFNYRHRITEGERLCSHEPHMTFILYNSFMLRSNLTLKCLLFFSLLMNVISAMYPVWWPVL